MSQIPQRLGETTLGDVLASLHRERASGTLELHVGSYRHAVHLRGGMVQAVERHPSQPRFGEVVSSVGHCHHERVELALTRHRARSWRVGQCLVAERVISPRERDRLLDAQRAHRLECLYALSEAALRWTPPRALPPGAAEQRPMTERSVYHGRPRATSRRPSSPRG